MGSLIGVGKPFLPNCMVSGLWRVQSHRASISSFSVMFSKLFVLAGMKTNMVLNASS